MTLTILFDLDDTLLIGSTMNFIPAYLESFSAQLSQITDQPEKIIPALLAATERMSRNNDPSITLKEVFDADFYPAMGWDFRTPQRLIKDFYLTQYPKFREMTSPNPPGLDLVKKIRSRGDQIIIATNPIFPMLAVDQRINGRTLLLNSKHFL